MSKTINWFFRGVFLIALLTYLACKETEDEMPMEEPDLLVQLESIPGFTVREIATVDHFQRLFEIRIEQPLDHDNPNGASFEQKMYLAHVEESIPMVVETEGYSRDNHRTRDLASLMEVNQLGIEHRYFGESRLQPIDWQYLTIEQAARDHHRIIELLKPIYTGKWVSSGRSKGGDAAIFHRRFFPDDLDATVAFVAPILFAERDERFLNYLDTVGEEACREKIKDFQRNMLLKVDSMPAYFEAYVQYINDNYNTDFHFSITYQTVVRYGMLDFPFEFWSSNATCEDIPGNNATVEELFNFFTSTVDVLLYFSDYGIDFWTPYIYQTRIELGDYAYDTSYLDDLLGPIDEDQTFSFNFGATSFDPAVMLDIDNWVKSDASEMVFIYGAEDPWTVAAVNIGANGNVYKFIAPGVKHSAGIEDLVTNEQDFVKAKLSEWLEWDHFK